MLSYTEKIKAEEREKIILEVLETAKAKGIPYSIVFKLERVAETEQQKYLDKLSKEN